VRAPELRKELDFEDLILSPDDGVLKLRTPMLLEEIALNVAAGTPARLRVGREAAVSPPLIQVVGR
jgi:hypothetical protein